MSGAGDRELIEAMTEIGTLRSLTVSLAREVTALKAAVNGHEERLDRLHEAVDELFAWLREVHDRQPHVPEDVLARALALYEERRR